jgi:O-antigen/teichoic acid export membrane protein
MAKGIMANSALNAAAGMTMLLTGFLSSIITARILGPEANGIIAFSFWLTTSGTLIAGLGVDVMLPRILPQLRVQGVGEIRRRGFAAYFARGIIIATFAFLAVYGLFVWSPLDATWTPAAPGVAEITGLLFVVQALGMISVHFLIAEQRLEVFVRLSVISALCQVAAVLVGALVHGAEGALFGYVAGQAIFLVHTLGILRNRADPCGFTLPYLARTSLIITVQIVIESIFLSRIELLFLQRFLDVHVVGFYAVGLSLANLALQLPVQATGSLVPYYTQQLQARGGGRLPVHLFAGVMRSLAYITMPMSFGLAAIAPALVSAVFGEAFRPSGGIVALLALSAPLSVFIQVGTKCMFATHLERRRAIIGGLAAIVMVAGCWGLVPALGGEGAAIARIVTFLAMSVLIVRQMQFEGSLLPMAVSILKISTAALACAATAYLVEMELKGVFGLMIAIACGAIVYVVGLRLLAAVPKEDIAAVEPMFNRLPRGIGQGAKRVLALVTN